MIINNCPVCESIKLVNILQRDNMPVYQNLLINSYDRARDIVKGDLSVYQCEDCGFVFNQAFDSNKVVYGSDYENTQSYSPYFTQYLDELINELVLNKGVQNVNIVEVGCGKGHFLKKIAMIGNNSGYGFDPSYIGPDIELDGKVRFEKRLYNEECTEIQADVVICRHVIEHIQSPLIILKAIRAALAHSPHASVYFETPCVDWILNNKIMFDFFYEHCSYFNKSSLEKAFILSGFEVISIDHIFNGQYMWLEAKPLQSTEKLAARKYSNEDISSSTLFAQYEMEWLDVIRKQLHGYSHKGNIAIWGAGAKGVTFLNMIDIDRKYISCVIDINPNKVGKFIPGTGHEIVGINELDISEISTIIVMNPNYFEEIKLLVEKKQLNITCINIDSLGA